MGRYDDGPGHSPRVRFALTPSNASTGPGWGPSRGVYPGIDANTLVWVSIGSVVVALFAYGAVRARSRLRLLGQGAGATGAVLMWWVPGPWNWAPAWTFGLAAGLAAGALVVAVRRWGGLPWLPPRRRTVPAVVFTLGSAWLVAMPALTAWVALLRP